MGLLLVERMQDMLEDLNPAAARNQPTDSLSACSSLEAKLTPMLADRSFFIVLDNVHAHDKGTVSIHRHNCKTPLPPDTFFLDFEECNLTARLVAAVGSSERLIKKFILRRGARVKSKATQCPKQTEGSAGTVESFCRVAAKHCGKVLVTSCQSNFGPRCGAAEVVSIQASAVKHSGVATRLLLAEAGLIFLRAPEADLRAVDPLILVCSTALLIDGASPITLRAYCSAP